MGIKNNVEAKIAEGFDTVLKKTPFEKVKVTDVIKVAGISHQTFYRYYVDKYDWAYKTACDKFSAFELIYGSNASWREVVISILHSIKNAPLFFKRMLADSVGKEIIYRAVLFVAARFTKESSSEPGFSGWIRIFSDWCQDNFQTPVEEIYHKIRCTVPIQEVLSADELEQVLAQYENRHLDSFAQKQDE